MPADKQLLWTQSPGRHVGLLQPIILHSIDPFPPLLDARLKGRVLLDFIRLCGNIHYIFHAWGLSRGDCPRCKCLSGRTRFFYLMNFASIAEAIPEFYEAVLPLHRLFYFGMNMMLLSIVSK